MQKENKIIVSGIVAYPPELIYLPSGQAKLSFQIEIEEPKVGQYETTTRAWKYKVVLLGEQAEGLIEQMKPGAGIKVEGQIYTYSWKPPSSEQWLQRTEILANEVKFLSLPPVELESAELPF